MNDTVLLGAELDLASFCVGYGGRNIHGNGAEFRVRHQAARAKNLTETADNSHHVRGCNNAIIVQIAFLHCFHQVFGANSVCTSFLGFFCFGFFCEDSNAHGFTGTMRQGNNTTDHLVSVTRINTKVHRHFDGFIEFGFCTFLDELHSSCEFVLGVTVDALIGLGKAFTSLGHRLTPQPRDPSHGQSPRSLPSRHQRQMR